MQNQRGLARWWAGHADESGFNASAKGWVIAERLLSADSARLSGLARIMQVNISQIAYFSRIDSVGASGRG
jgi:hypothetical protein